MNESLKKKIKIQNEIIGKALLRIYNETKKDEILARDCLNHIRPFDFITGNFILELKNFLISDLCKYSSEKLEETISILDLGSKGDESERIIYASEILGKTVAVGFLETMGLICISETLKKQEKKELKLKLVASLGSRLDSLTFRSKTGLYDFMELDLVKAKDVSFPFLLDKKFSLSNDRDPDVKCPATFENNFSNFELMIKVGYKYWDNYFKEYFELEKEVFGKEAKGHMQNLFLNNCIHIDLKYEKYVKSI